MNEKELLQELLTMKIRIEELEKQKGLGIKRFFKRSFHRSHVAVGIILTAIFSSLIVYAAQITFSPGQTISSADVNANFEELYNLATIGASAKVGTNQVLTSASSATINFTTVIYNDGNFSSNSYTVSQDGIYFLSTNLIATSCMGAKEDDNGKILPGTVNFTMRVNGTDQPYSLYDTSRTVELTQGDVVTFYADGSSCTTTDGIISGDSFIILKRFF